MAKLSFMKFVPADWINDTRGLSLAAKGAWIDILSFMWNAPQRGCWQGSKNQLARLIGCPDSQVKPILSELAKIGTVTFRNNLVTLKNRRMIKQEIHYKSNAIRQARFRRNANSNASVTDKTLDVRRYKTLDVRQHPEGDARRRAIPSPLSSLSEYVNGWEAKSLADRKSNAAEIAQGLKVYGLGFRIEEDIYNKIMEDNTHGPASGTSIFKQAAEHRAKERLAQERKRNERAVSDSERSVPPLSPKHQDDPRTGS